MTAARTTSKMAKTSKEEKRQRKVDQLSEAIIANDLATFRDILRKPGSQKLIDGRRSGVPGAPVLHVAAHFGRSEMVRLLLKAKADVDAATTERGETPMFAASHNGIGHIEAIKFLESQEPVPSLRWDESMSKAARDHAEDLNYHTLVQHESSQYASIELMGKNDGVE